MLLGLLAHNLWGLMRLRRRATDNPTRVMFAPSDKWFAVVEIQDTARLRPRTSADIGACGEHQQRGCCPGRMSKERPRPVGAGRSTGWNGGPVPLVSALPSSPPVLRARLNATTTSGDSRLIIVNLHVAGHPGFRCDDQSISCTLVAPSVVTDVLFSPCFLKC